MERDRLRIEALTRLQVFLPLLNIDNTEHDTSRVVSCRVKK